MNKTRSALGWAFALMLILGCIPAFRMPFAPTPATLDVPGVIRLQPALEPIFTSGVWSPDGKHLAVVKGISTGASYAIPAEDSFNEILILDIENDESRKIDVSNPGDRRVLAWLPGDQISFFGNNDLPAGTWTAPADGASSREMVLEDAAAAWSPDGERIAYLRLEKSSAPNSLSIFIRDLQTLEEQVAFHIEQNFLLSGSLTWSPDGNRLLFLLGVSSASYEESFERLDLHSLDLASGELKKLTDGQHPVSAAWSPDQTMIAYIRRVKDERYYGEVLYAMRADGSCPVQLFNPEPYDVEWVSWSPDGKWLAFAWGWRLYLLDTDQSPGIRSLRSGAVCP
jgi:Tol biopolymer transport system component